MPRFSQGDIFTLFATKQIDVAIVFGHIGLNEMNLYWEEFKNAHDNFAEIRDPFLEIPERPVCVSNDQWLWFVPEKENHGMTDDQLVSAIEKPIGWALNHGLTKIATNGIINIDHGSVTLRNRESVDRRVHFLAALVSDHEQNSSLSIELISLNDAFVRNVA